MKYHNHKTIVDGIAFDSKKEANRYQELKLMERGGLISNIELQPRYTLLEAFTDKMGKKHRKIEYVADFAYYDRLVKEWVTEDVKSKATRTPLYMLKKKLLLFRYQNINFLEIF